MFAQNQKFSGMFLQKPKMRTHCFHSSVFTFVRNTSERHGQTESDSQLEAKPESVLLGHNSPAAQCEIKKDNKPDTLISLPPDMQL